MAEMIFKINGNKIATPSDFTIELQPITEAERLENGDMKITAIVGKYKGVLNYAFISEANLRVILGYTWDAFLSSKKITQTFTFPTPNGSKTIQSYFSPFNIKITPSTLKAGGYEGIQISFIEL